MDDKGGAPRDSSYGTPGVRGVRGEPGELGNIGSGSGPAGVNTTPVLHVVGHVNRFCYTITRVPYSYEFPYPRADRTSHLR